MYVCVYVERGRRKEWWPLCLEVLLLHVQGEREQIVTIGFGGLTAVNVLSEGGQNVDGTFSR